MLDGLAELMLGLLEFFRNLGQDSLVSGCRIVKPFALLRIFVV